MTVNLCAISPQQKKTLSNWLISFDYLKKWCNLSGEIMYKSLSEVRVIFVYIMQIKALHSKLLTKLSSRFSSWNEFFFAIFEFRVERHIFIIFGKFGKEQFLNSFWNFWPKNRFFDSKTGFFVKFQILHSFIWNFCNWRTILVNIRTFFLTFLQKFC